MATATTGDDYEDVHTCYVCYDRFTDPRSLPCGHAFCLKCIDAVHRHTVRKNSPKPNEIRCPICNKTHFLHGGSVSNLPKYYQATQMMDCINSLEKMQIHHRYQCGACKDQSKQVAGYCFSCMKPFCSGCGQKHDKVERFSGHVQIDVTEDKLRFLECEKHHEMVHVYCCDCLKPLCKVCQMKYHAEHKIKGFVKSKSVQQGRHSRRDIDGTMGEFYASIKDINTKIASHTKPLISYIEKQEVDSYRQALYKEWKRLKLQLSKYDNLIWKASEQIKQLMHPIPQLPVVGVQHLNDLITDIEQNIKHARMDIEENYIYKLIPGTKSIEFGIVAADNEDALPEDAESNPFRKPTAELDNSASEPSTCDDSDTDELWALVRTYKALKERRRELLGDTAQDLEGSEGSTMSDRSLIDAQLQSLAEIDTHIQEDGANGLAACGGPVEEAAAMCFDDVKVPDIKETFTASALLADVHELTRQLERCFNGDGEH